MAKEKKPNKRPYGMGQVYKRKDGRFVAKLPTSEKRKDGRTKFKEFYGKSEQEALNKMEEFMYSHNMIRIDTGKTTVAQYMKGWMDKKKIELKPTSYSRLEMTANKHIIPYIGHIPIKNLTDNEIQTLIINRMFEDNLSLSSIRKAYQCLNNCINFAIDRRDLDYNPMGVVSVPSSSRFKSKDEKYKYFDKDDVITFSKLAASQNDNFEYNYKYGPMFVVMLNTGLRSGEARALKVRDFDIKDKTLYVHANVITYRDPSRPKGQREIRMIQESTKTESGERVVTLNSLAWQQLVLMTEGKQPNDLILSTPQGDPISATNFERAFKAICTRAGFFDADGNLIYTGLHTLRHTYASFMFNNNFDIKIISQQMGHSDIQTTYNIYTHLINGRKVNEIADMKSLTAK